MSSPPPLPPPPLQNATHTSSSPSLLRDKQHEFLPKPDHVPTTVRKFEEKRHSTDLSRKNKKKKKKKKKISQFSYYLFFFLKKRTTSIIRTQTRLTSRRAAERRVTNVDKQRANNIVRIATHHSEQSGISRIANRTRHSLATRAFGRRSAAGDSCSRRNCRCYQQQQQWCQ
jgi:hypothetical protein